MIRGIKKHIELIQTSYYFIIFKKKKDTIVVISQTTEQIGQNCQNFSTISKIFFLNYISTILIE